MDELHSILATHHARTKSRSRAVSPGEIAQSFPKPSVSEIPDLFFDEVLVKNRMSRIETLVFMYIYRQVWCRANLHKRYGIGPMLGYQEMATTLDLTVEDIQNAIRKLESFSFLETIRPGQYFVRRYITEENDAKYGQFYDDF